MQQYYAYVYRDEDGIPFYVGKGTKHRAYDHLKRPGSNFFGNKLKKMLLENKQPDIEIINAINEDHAYFLEECLIQVFGRRDLGTGTLCNLTSGGDGIRNISPESAASRYSKTRGQKRSDETKAKIRAVHLGKSKPSLTAAHKAKIASSLSGKTRDPAISEKVSAAFKRRRELGIKSKIRAPITDEARENIRKARLGKKHTEESKLKMSITRQKSKEIKLN